jgi:hypothetical protein
LKKACNDRSERLQPTPIVAARRLELTRLSPSSSPVAEESQEQPDSWPIKDIPIAVSDDVGVASSSVDSLVQFPQPRSETNELPAKVSPLQPLFLVACKLLTRIDRVLVAVSVYGVVLSQLGCNQSALSLSKFAWIPGEEIPPEPPPYLPIHLRVQEFFS